MYADDIVKLAESQSDLQKGLDILYDYCQKWKLTVNTSKTKCMVFRKYGLKNTDFYYNNEKLEVVKHFKFLGVVFSANGSFTEAQNTLCGQAEKAIFKLHKYLHKFCQIPTKHYLELFDKLVTPILNYGCEVWGFCKADKIERVHLKFCKKLLGVKLSTQNDMIYGELGRFHLQINRFCRIIKYWLKVVRCKVLQGEILLKFHSVICQQF
jgi:(p)ppGpp synthase/HD superfamily hydrolase